MTPRLLSSSGPRLAQVSDQEGVTLVRDCLGILTDLGSGLQQQRRAPFHSRPIFESEVSRCSMSMRSVFRRHSELIMGLSDSSNNRCNVPLTTDSGVSKRHSIRQLQTELQVSRIERAASLSEV